MITEIGKVSAYCCCNRYGNKLGAATGNTGFFQSWGPLWDVLTGAERQRAIELNQKIEELNKKRVEQGKLTQKQADDAQAALWSENPDDYRSIVGDAFNEGAAEGIKAQQDFLEMFANKFTRTAVGYVPTVVWIGLGVAAAWYLGVFDNLKGSLGRKMRY